MPDDRRPRDRDSRVTTSPPVGSRAATAMEAVPVMFEDEKTNPHASEFDKLQHRAQRAAAHAKAALTATAELRQDVAILDSEVRTIGERQAKAQGSLDILVDMSRQVVGARVDVAKAERLATVDEGKAQRAHKRAIVLQLLAAVTSGSVITAVIAYAGKC